MFPYRVTIARTSDLARFARVINADSEAAALRKAYGLLASDPAEYYVVSVCPAGK